MNPCPDVFSFGGGDYRIDMRPDPNPIDSSDWTEITTSQDLVQIVKVAGSRTVTVSIDDEALDQIAVQHLSTRLGAEVGMRLATDLGLQAVRLDCPERSGSYCTPHPD